MTKQEIQAMIKAQADKTAQQIKALEDKHNKAVKGLVKAIAENTQELPDGLFGGLTHGDEAAISRKLQMRDTAGAVKLLCAALTPPPSE